MFGKFLRKRKKAKEKKATAKAKLTSQKKIITKVSPSPKPLEKNKILTAEGWLKLKLKKKL